MTELLHKELTHAIIGAYYRVFNGTGRTYPEYIYERAMARELREQGLPLVRQDEYRIVYKDRLVGVQILDLFVVRQICVEIKVAPSLTRLHRAQAISYLKVTGRSVGLLLNFGGTEPEFERLYFEPRQPANTPASDEVASRVSDLPDNLLAPELVYTVVGGLFEVHSVLGPGFIHRIYANACYHELRLRGVGVRPLKEMQVYYRGEPIGQIKFGHLLVDGQFMVFPAAIQNPDDLSLNNLKDWMRAMDAPLGVLANFYDTSLKPVVLRV